MSDKTNAAQAGESMPVESAPLDLHGLYRNQAACGYTRDLTLRSHIVQSITARLRGISTITAVLIASDNTEMLHLGDWLRAGLTEAISALASDAQDDIERINNQAQKERGAA